MVQIQGAILGVFMMTFPAMAQIVITVCKNITYFSLFKNEQVKEALMEVLPASFIQTLVEQEMGFIILIVMMVLLVALFVIGSVAKSEKMQNRI